MTAECLAASVRQMLHPLSNLVFPAHVAAPFGVRGSCVGITLKKDCVPGFFKNKMMSDGLMIVICELQLPSITSSHTLCPTALRTFSPSSVNEEFNPKSCQRVEHGDVGALVAQGSKLGLWGQRKGYRSS